MNGLLVLGIGLLIILAGCASSETPDETWKNKPSTLAVESLAACLTEKGVKMYGSYICSSCAKQRESFGSAFAQIEEIECHPKGVNPQTQRCLDMKVDKTPTWILEKEGAEISRLEGYQSFENLAQLSGCAYG